MMRRPASSFARTPQMRHRRNKRGRIQQRAVRTDPHRRAPARRNDADGPPTHRGRADCRNPKPDDRPLADRGIRADRLAEVSVVLTADLARLLAQSLDAPFSGKGGQNSSGPAASTSPTDRLATRMAVISGALSETSALRILGK